MRCREPSMHSVRRTRWPWFGTLILFCSVLGLVLFISEPPFTHSRPIARDSQERAAVAIRDAASPYLQWATMLFAWPTLQKGYDRVYYFNQRTDEDQKERIIGTLRKVLEHYRHVDLYLLAHGSNRFVNWVREHLSYTEIRRLRLVYNTGCGNESQGALWRKLGVHAYVGHGGGVSVSPIFFFFFVRRWVRNYTLEQSVHEANWYTRHHLLLLGKLSIGQLSGSQMWLDTRAIRFGPPHLKITASEQPLWVSHLTPRVHSRR